MTNNFKQPKVSVHIVTYNSADHIVKCLEAIFTQSYPIAQIIIVDNASKDSTRLLLQPYEKQALFVFNENNLGFAPAHNQAISHSSGEFCLILNPDVILQANFVSNLIWAMSKDTHIGSATGKLFLQSSSGTIDSTGLVINKIRRAFDRDAGKRDSEFEYTHHGQNIEIFGVSGAAAMYSRSMIDNISIDGQFFDESFFAYKEDVDVAWRAQLYGWSSIYVSDAIALHERGWKSGARSKQPLFIRRHSYINRYRMLIKNDQISTFLRHFVQILPYEIASLGYLLLREPLVLIAWYRFFKDLPNLLKQRKEIQAEARLRINKNVYRFFH